MSAWGTREATVVAVADLCRRHPQAEVLDVGCGGGDLLIALAPWISRGHGIDTSAAAIAHASQQAAGQPHLSFGAAAAEDLADADCGHFDLVVFGGSLEHMHDATRALAAAGSRLRRDGRIVVIALPPRAPHAAFTRWWLKNSSLPVVAHRGAAELAPVARQAGLEIERVYPLYRGSRRSLLARAAAPVLYAYDRIGGPTSAIVLRPMAAANPAATPTTTVGQAV